MDIESLNKAYEAIEMLKALDLPVSDEQVRGIATLEKQYILENVIPSLKKEIEPFLASVRNNFKMSVSYIPQEGVSCSLGNNQNVIQIKNESSSRRDLTKYSIDGGQPLNKRRFVLAVVKEYVKRHPNVTYEELETRFPSTLSHSMTYGVFQKYDDIIEKAETQPDLLKRFMLEPEELILLNDGTKITIYNQWGHTFDRFLALAKTLHEVEGFE